MTVQHEFFDWGRNPMTPSPGRCAPICQTWMRYLLDRWGGQNLGCFVSRPVVGGSTPSTHASGAAIDWRYQSPGIGRQRMLNEVMPWLLNNSRELGLIAVHDYAGMRIWRPPGQSGRPTSPSPECGWRPNSGNQMNPANTWLHIECLNTRWSDTRSVPDMLPDDENGDDELTEDQANQLQATFEMTDWTWQALQQTVLPALADLQERMAAQEAIWPQDAANQLQAAYVTSDWTWQVAAQMEPQAAKAVKPATTDPSHP